MGSYAHVYNRGVENRTIFSDEADYQTFLNYLEEYLCPPKALENHKKDFTINGRVYRGVPHQPKNYHTQVELISYSLQPQAFHLLLHQKKVKSLQALIRSLCTRYSIYFNKKYNRTGALFDGPYKSAQLADERSRILLVNHLNKASSHSSHAEYTGQRNTPWVITISVQNTTDTHSGYKQNNSNYEPSVDDLKLLDKIPMEKPNNSHLERRDLKAEHLKPWSRIPEMLGASIVFVLLLGIGYRNVASLSQGSSPATLGTNTTTNEQTPVPSTEPASAVENIEASTSASTQDPSAGQSAETLEQ